MNVVVFIDYSDPLGGLLSWIADLSAFANNLEFVLVGVVTDESRPRWANVITPDAPTPMISLRPDEIDKARESAGLADLPDSLRSILSRGDLYIPNAYETGYQTALVARQFNLPAAIVAFTHSDEPHYYYLAERYQSVVSKFLVAESRSYKGIAERLPHRCEDLVKIPHGLRIPPPVDRHPSPIMRILYAGRVVQLQKCVFDLITLARKLRELNVPFRIDVIGDGDERPELERRAVREAPEISCLGPVRRNSLLHRYKDYDCFLLCSSFEGMSIALMEAMAHGVVPVVTDVGGARDLITPGAEGFLWEVGDFCLAAQHIDRLWRNPETLRRCSLAARARIASAHDPALCTSRLVSTLVDAATNPRGSRTEAMKLLASNERSPYFPES